MNIIGILVQAITLPFTVVFEVLGLTLTNVIVAVVGSFTSIIPTPKN